MSFLVPYLNKLEQLGNKIRVPLAKHIGLADLLKQVWKEASEDHLGDFAASLTYHGIFAIFPFLTFLISMLGIFDKVLGLFDTSQLIKDFLSRPQVRQAIPVEVIDFVQQQIDRLIGNIRPGTFTTGAIVSILLALWGVSGAFRSIMESLNVVYEIKDSRPIWKKYLISIMLSVIAVLLLLSAGILAVFGPKIADWLARTTGLGTLFAWSWKIAQWPLLILIALLAFALIYHYGPDIKQPLRLVTPGSILALLGWLVFTLIFSLYVNNFGNYNKTYGTLAGAILLMLYMYYSSYILLMGGEVNHVVETYSKTSEEVKQSV